MSPTAKRAAAPRRLTSPRSRCMPTLQKHWRHGELGERRDSDHDQRDRGSPRPLGPHRWRKRSYPRSGKCRRQYHCVERGQHASRHLSDLASGSARPVPVAVGWVGYVSTVVMRDVPVEGVRRALSDGCDDRRSDSQRVKHQDYDAGSQQRPGNQVWSDPTAGSGLGRARRPPVQEHPKQ